MTEILWNCRGVGARTFPGLIKELKCKYNLTWCALFETKSSGAKAKKIASKLCFRNSCLGDARGFNGGLWFAWDDGD